MAFSIAQYKAPDYASNDGYMFPIRPLGTTPQTSSVCKLPYELLDIIFKLMDPTTSTCLALTSKALYALYERLHPSIVRLDSHTTVKHVPCPSSTMSGSKRDNVVLIEVKEEDVYLHQLLKTWVGPQYDYADTTPVFLNVAVYGDCITKNHFHFKQKRMSLTSRYNDYELSRAHALVYLPADHNQPRIVSHKGTTNCPTPSAWEKHHRRPLKHGKRYAAKICHDWVKYWGRTELYWYSDEEAIRSIKGAREKVWGKENVTSLSFPRRPYGYYLR